MNESDFRKAVALQGFGEPQLVEKAPDLALDEHTHEFSAFALILSGQLSVTTAKGTTTCGAGDTFALDSGIPHSEQYGPEGARFLVARRTP